jgi:hypothetical protein
MDERVEYGCIMENARLKPIHEKLLDCVRAAIEMREGNGFSCEYTEEQRDKFDEALSALEKELEKS